MNREQRIPHKINVIVCVCMCVRVRVLYLLFYRVNLHRNRLCQYKINNTNTIGCWKRSSSCKLFEKHSLFLYASINIMNELYFLILLYLKVNQESNGWFKKKGKKQQVVLIPSTFVIDCKYFCVSSISIFFLLLCADNVCRCSRQFYVVFFPIHIHVATTQ